MIDHPATRLAITAADWLAANITTTAKGRYIRSPHMEYVHPILLLLVQLASYAYCSLSPKNTGNPAAANGSGSPSQEMVKWLDIFFSPTARLEDWTGCYQAVKCDVVTMLNVPSESVEPICGRLRRDGLNVEFIKSTSFYNKWTISGYHRESVKTTRGKILSCRDDHNQENLMGEYVKGYLCTVSEYPKELLKVTPTGRLE